MSTSYILDKETDFIPTHFNLKFLAKFGDTTTVDKIFKHFFPKYFESQQYLFEEAKPKESGSSNLQLLDDESEQDEEMEEIVGHNPRCSPPVSKLKELAINNNFANNFGSTVDFDYSCQVRHAEEDNLSQLSKSEKEVGDSSQDEKETFDVIDSCEGTLHNLFSDRALEMTTVPEEGGSLRFTEETQR